MTENPLRKTVYIWLIITIASFVMIFMPDALGIECFEGGCAISFVSFFAVIIGVIVMFVYNGLASRLDKILNGENLLAHWTYTPEMWNEFTEKEFQTQKVETKPLFYIVSGFALFFGILFFALDHEAGFYVLIVMLALIVIIWLTSTIIPALNHRRNMKYLGEAYISRNGVYLNRQLFTWNFLSSRIENVALKNEKGLMLLSITTWAFTMTFGQEYTVRIPVPPGQEEKAMEIASELSQHARNRG